MGSIHPWTKDLFLLGIINSGSMETLVPKPSHVLQAPNGELKENALGCNSSKEISHLGHEKNSLNKCSLFPISLIITKPFPIFKANSIEPVNLSLMFSLIINLSTITSIKCFLFFVNLTS